jgi:hypothetical protein
MPATQTQPSASSRSQPNCRSIISNDNSIGNQYFEKKIASTCAVWTVGATSEFKKADPFVSAAHSNRIDCR